MSKINGIKLVRNHGVINLEATLAAWDKRAMDQLLEDRNKFQKEIEAYQATSSEWDETFSQELKTFWEAYPKARIAKSVIVNMVTTDMVKRDKFPITKLQDMQELFTAFLDSNIGEPGSGSWMEQGKGRAGQVWETQTT